MLAALKCTVGNGLDLIADGDAGQGLALEHTRTDCGNGIGQCIVTFARACVENDLREISVVKNAFVFLYGGIV